MTHSEREKNAHLCPYQLISKFHMHFTSRSSIFRLQLFFKISFLVQNISSGLSFLFRNNSRWLTRTVPINCIFKVHCSTLLVKCHVCQMCKSRVYSAKSKNSGKKIAPLGLLAYLPPSPIFPPLPPIPLLGG
jgi:hypothetical protein